MKPHRVSAILAHGDDKERLMLQFLQSRAGQTHIVFAFSKSETTRATLRQVIPSAFVWETFEPERLRGFVNAVKAIGQQRNALVILDDARFARCSTALEMVQVKRCYDYELLLLCDTVRVPCEVRSCTDYVFCTTEAADESERQQWHADWFADIQPYRSFEQLLSAAGVLVLDNTVSSRELALGFVEREKFIESFRLCSPVYWQLSEKYESASE